MACPAARVGRGVGAGQGVTVGGSSTVAIGLGGTECAGWVMVGGGSEITSVDLVQAARREMEKQIMNNKR